MHKSFKILIAIFFIQFLSSCLTCPDLEYFEITYQDVELSLFDRDSLTSSEIQRKNFSGLIALNFNQEKTDGLSLNVPFLVNSSYATEKCESRAYKYKDSFTDIKIMLIKENEPDSDVTERFYTKDYSGHATSLKNFVEEHFYPSEGYDRDYRIDRFNIYAYNAENLPNSFSLKIILDLKSGAKLEAISNKVVFK